MSKRLNKNTNITTAKQVLNLGSKMNWASKENKRFIAAILSLKTSDEAERFLRDLMTEQEIVEFGKRLEAAYQLSQNVQYNSITESTGLSSTTIARIAKWLGGSLGGYRLVLSRLSNQHHSPSKLRKGLSLSS